MRHRSLASLCLLVLALTACSSTDEAAPAPTVTVTQTVPAPETTVTVEPRRTTTRIEEMRSQEALDAAGAAAEQAEQARQAACSLADDLTFQIMDLGAERHRMLMDEMGGDASLDPPSDQILDQMDDLRSLQMQAQSSCHS